MKQSTRVIIVIAALSLLTIGGGKAEENT